eukprot:859790_1
MARSALSGWIDLSIGSSIELPFLFQSNTETIVCLAPTPAPTYAPAHPTHVPSHPTSTPSMAPIAAPTRSPTPWCPMLNLTVIDRIIPTHEPTYEPINVRRRNLLANPSGSPTATPTHLPTPNVTIFDEHVFEGLYVYIEAINHLPVFEAPY